jgi:hypothetical protein
VGEAHHQLGKPWNRWRSGWLICGSRGLVGLGYLRDAVVARLWPGMTVFGDATGRRRLPARGWQGGPAVQSNTCATTRWTVGRTGPQPGGARRQAALPISRDAGSLPPSARGWQGAWWKGTAAGLLWSWMANRPQQGGLPCTVCKLLRPRSARLTGRDYQADDAGRDVALVVVPPAVAVSASGLRGEGSEPGDRPDP